MHGQPGSSSEGLRTSSMLIAFRRLFSAMAAQSLRCCRCRLPD